MTPDRFIHRITVPDSAIDDLEHVNNIVYLQWCLDAAESHWVSLTDEHLRERNIWVVLDHSISYKSPAYKGEEIEVHTWVAMNKGVRSERQYRIIRSKDQQL